MKPYIVLSFAAAALVSLSACGQSQPEVVDNKAPDPIAARAAEAPPVEMPAAVKDSRSYRCKDNSVIYVDFLADDVSANLRTARDATPVALKAAAPGDPFKRSEERRVGKECVSTGRSRGAPDH